MSLLVKNKLINPLKQLFISNKIFYGSQRIILKSVSTFSDEISPDRTLYDGHIPTSRLQKLLLSVGSGYMSLRQPWRDDMIAVMGESTGYCALKYMRQKMLEDSTGRQILEEKPSLSTNTIDLDYLKSLPDDTFGKSYYMFLEKNNISPDTRRQVNFIDDPDLAYVMKRYREIHDLIHTILGAQTDMLGEVAVKWVEGMQTRLPMCVLGAIFGPVRFGPKQRKNYFKEQLSIAIYNGKNAKFLMNIFYEKHWEDNLDEFRSFLGVKPLTYVRSKSKKSRHWEAPS